MTVTVGTLQKLSPGTNRSGPLANGLTWTWASSDSTIAKVTTNATGSTPAGSVVSQGDVWVLGVAAGTCTVTLTISDGNGNSIASNSESVTVTANQTATISNIAFNCGPSPLNIPLNQAATVAAKLTLTGPLGTGLTYTWATSDGTVAKVGHGADYGTSLTSAGVGPVFVKGVGVGSCSLSLTISDANSNTTSLSYTVTVSANEVFDIGSVTITPADAGTIG